MHTSAHIRAWFAFVGLSLSLSLSHPTFQCLARRVSVMANVRKREREETTKWGREDWPRRKVIIYEGAGFINSIPRHFVDRWINYMQLFTEIYFMSTVHPKDIKCNVQGNSFILSPYHVTFALTLEAGYRSELAMDTHPNAHVSLFLLLSLCLLDTLRSNTTPDVQFTSVEHLK